jgi:hypothetical protein
LTTTVKLTLLDCLLEEGITAEAAHLPGLSLLRCLLTHQSKPALYADELWTDSGVSFEGSTILANTADAAVRMNGARIGGQLNFSGATIRNPLGPAVNADALQAERVFLRSRFTADGFGKLGAIRVLGARIGGPLDCSDASIRNPCGPALIADDLHAESVELRAGFSADGQSPQGAVRLVAACIGGPLDCSGATISNPSGPALIADTLQAGGSVFLRESFSADGVGELGSVRLFRARIGGQLDAQAPAFATRLVPP